MWVATKDDRRLLKAVEVEKPTAASVAIIGPGLTTHVFAGPTDPVELPPRSPGDIRGDEAVLSMVMFRYQSRETAKELALKAPTNSVLEVEMTIRGDADGSRHVSDPYFGVEAFAKSNIVWWGGFGLVFGALAGGLGGGGVLGIVEDGLSTAIVWGIVGLGVGVLYGFVFGKAVSARRLKSVGSLVAPGTSILMAWVDGKSPLTEGALDAYSRPGSQRLVLNLNSTRGGTVLEATDAA